MWMAFDRWKMKQKQKVTYGSVLRSSLIGCIFLVGPLLMYVGSRQRPVVATGLRQEHVSTFSSPMFSTAIFLHIQSDTPMLEEIAQCMANVVHAANETDIHVFHSATTELNNLNVPVGVGRLTFHVTDESDWVAFIQGLWMLKKKGVFYKSVLKLSNADVILQHRTLEALCGSREQVKSILDVLHDPGPVMVAPMGTVFTPRAPPNKVCPHIKEELFNNIDAATMLLAQNIVSLDSALRPESGNKMNITKDLLFATGSFWINRFALPGETWNDVERLQNGLRSLSTIHESSSLMKYTQDGWLPSSIQARGGTVRDIQPAPKVFAIYFPQYHRFPENDRFWGDGFTEWTLLRNLSLGPVPLRKPLQMENGGLGYYDLESFETRKQQAQLAREHGVSGFMYYHYWFSGKGAPKDHVVMQKIPELMLKDGQPDLPFLMSWANEPWTRRWTGQGATADTLLAQEYGDEKEWREHFFYLLKFFKHPKYLRIQNAPVFAIYRLGHMKAVAKEMFSFWQMLARENGLPSGLHLVHTLGGFYRFDNTEPVLKAADFHASFHFWPLACDSFGEMCPDGDKWQSKFASSLSDAPFGLGDKHRQYWGAFVGFDRRPRDHGFPRFCVPRSNLMIACG